MIIKIYTDRKKARMEVLQLFGWGTLGVLALYPLNIVTNLMGFVVVPHILLLPLFFFFIAVYRNIWLYFLPMIIITNKHFKHFNLLYYTTSDWTTIETVYLSKERSELILMQDTGRVLQSIDLHILSETDYNSLLETIQSYKEIIFE